MHFRLLPSMVVNEICYQPCHCNNCCQVNTIRCIRSPIEIIFIYNFFLTFTNAESLLVIIWTTLYFLISLMISYSNFAMYLWSLILFDTSIDFKNIVYPFEYIMNLIIDNFIGPPNHLIWLCNHKYSIVIFDCWHNHYCLLFSYLFLILYDDDVGTLILIFINKKYYINNMIYKL